MSKWINSVKAHPIHNSLKSFERNLSKVQDSKGIDVEHLELLERMKEIHQLLIEKIQNLNPNLVMIDTLDAINTHLSGQDTNLIRYMDNGGEIANLNKANGLANNILHLIATLPSPAPQVDIAVLRKEAETFRERTERYLQEIEKESITLKAKREELVSRLQSIIGEISAQKRRFDQAIAEFQSQFSQAENTRREQFTKAEATRLSQSTESRAALDAALAAFNKQWTELTVYGQAKFDTLLKEADVTIKVFEAEQKSSLHEHISQIESQKKRAEDIVHVISNTGMVGGYQRVANEERLRAIIWQSGAVVSLLGLIGFAIWAYRGATHTQFNWAVFSSRIFATVTFGILAAFASRQADKHHDIERRNRRVELELASIDPYILPLPKEVRNEVKRQLAERLFGQSDPTQSGKTPETPGNVIDLAKAALETVKAALDQLTKK